MGWQSTVVLVAVVSGSWAKLEFPPGFKFGAATASYQVEGAWNVSDKSPSTWDHYTHLNPAAIKDLSNGDVACDSYHNYKRDVEIAKELGLQFYRFSISWPRLLPSGFPDRISEDGKRYYNELIDELLRNDIEPVVTIYHWDLPQRLQELGGWVNPLISEWFGNYARVVYTLFGDRVKTWITLNEPIVICDMVYSGSWIPVFNDWDAVYMCNKNLLMAHATAYRIYDEEFRSEYDGAISVANHFIWLQPYSEEFEEVTELSREHFYGRYTHPIFSKEGGWPKALEKQIADLSKKQGYPRSRLPAFTKDEIKFIQGTYDYFAMNHYTSRLVRTPRDDETIIPIPLFGIEDVNAMFDLDPSWQKGAAFWFYVYPEGLRKMLRWVKEEYGDVKILITENGYCDTENTREDVIRVQYYKDYLEQVQLAITEDKVNVVGYTAWTMIDNFEWGEGYEIKFGLYEVDFNDPKRTRTPRQSARFYADIIRNHTLAGRDEL